MKFENQENQLKIIVEPLLKWYEENKRTLPWRMDQEPYHVWISEIMLQQTRVEAVKEYYKRFLKALPKISDLENVEEETLMKLWEGLGYYNRARNLKKAAHMIMEEYNGMFPDTYEEIKKLSGIGEYTAGAIASICYNLPVPAVDGNVLRVISRVLESYDNIDDVKTKQKIRELLKSIYPKNSCGEFTQSLMELGAILCKPNGVPNCEICPIAMCCKAYQNHVTANIPIRNEKKPRRHEDMTVFILKKGDKYAVRKRKKQGLLAGLWEFPNLSGKLKEQEAVSVISEWQMKPKDLEKVIEYRHIFTHVEWDMKAYYIECEDMALEHKDLKWVSAEEMNQTITLPSAFKTFWEAAL